MRGGLMTSARLPDDRAAAMLSPSPSPAHDRPFLTVELLLDSALAIPLTERAATRETIESQVRHAVAEIAHHLGVPGEVVTRVGAREHESELDSDWLDLVVNGTSCRYPADVLTFAWAYATGTVAADSPQEVRG